MYCMYNIIGGIGNVLDVLEESPGLSTLDMLFMNPHQNGLCSPDRWLQGVEGPGEAVCETSQSDTPVVSTVSNNRNRSRFTTVLGMSERLSELVVKEPQ